jgi:hypothetical protein
MYNDQINFAIDSIQSLVRMAPTITINRVDHRGRPAGTDEVSLVQFGYIGNCGRSGDHRRWLVFDNTTQYSKDSNGKWHWKGSIKNASAEPWGCESKDLTVEKLKEAYKAAAKAILKAQEMVK